MFHYLQIGKLLLQLVVPLPLEKKIGSPTQCGHYTVSLCWVQTLKKQVMYTVVAVSSNSSHPPSYSSAEGESVLTAYEGQEQDYGLSKH